MRRDPRLESILVRAHGDLPDRVVVAGASRCPGEVSGAARWAAHGDGAVAASDDLPDLPVRVGSITKGLVAALALLLHDAGRFDLDQSCAESLEIESAILAGVTWRAVLAHVARLPHECADWTSREATTPGQLLAAAERLDLLALPRGHWHYSNFGYGLVGLAIERQVGVSWDRLIAEELLVPLGMTRTGAVDPVGAVGGWAVVDGNLVPAEPVDFGACAPAGHLWSTLADLMRWASCLAGERPDVLSLDVLRRLSEPVSLAPRPAVAAGLGVQLLAAGDARAIVSIGVVPGYRAVVAACPDGSCAAMWINADAPASAVRLEGTLGQLLGAPTTASPAAGFEGDWWLDGQPLRLLHRGDEVVAILPDGTSAVRLFTGRVDGCRLVVDESADRIVVVDGQTLRWGSLTLTREAERSATIP